MSFKECVFFDGGKKFNLETSNHDSYFKMEKDANGNWIITAKFCLSIDEGKKSVDDFDSLGVPETEIPKLHNLIYLTAKDETGKSVPIEPVAANFMIGYDKDDRSEVILKMNIGGTGKTENGKTENPAVDH